MLALLPTLLWSVLGPQAEGADATHVRPLAAAVSVDPGATCLDPHLVTPKVVAYLGQPEVDTRIDVEVIGDPDDEYHVSFLVRRDNEVAAERAFDFPPKTSCEEIHAVVSVAVALAIDATLLEERPSTPEPEAPEPEPPRPEPTPPQPEPIDTQPPRPVQWHVSLALEGGATVAAPPPAAGAGALGLEVSWRDIVDLWVLGLGASAGAQPAGAGEAVLSVAGAGLGACGGWRGRVLHPRGCAGAVAGAAFATGQGFADDQRSRVPWAAIMVGGDLRFTVAPAIELGLGADVLVHVIRPAFDFLDAGERRRLGREFPPAGGWFAAQIVFRLR